MKGGTEAAETTNAADGEPRERGRIMFAAEIAKEVFAGLRTEAWVRRFVAPAAKLRLGHATVVWFEADVMAWLEAHRGN